MALPQDGIKDLVPRGVGVDERRCPAMRTRTVCKRAQNLCLGKVCPEKFQCSPDCSERTGPCPLLVQECILANQLRRREWLQQNPTKAKTTKPEQGKLISQIIAAKEADPPIKLGYDYRTQLERANVPLVHSLLQQYGLEERPLPSQIDIADIVEQRDNQQAPPANDPTEHRMDAPGGGVSCMLHHPNPSEMTPQPGIDPDPSLRQTREPEGMVNLQLLPTPHTGAVEISQRTSIPDSSPSTELTGPSHSNCLAKHDTESDEDSASSGQSSQDIISVASTRITGNTGLYRQSYNDNPFDGDDGFTGLGVSFAIAQTPLDMGENPVIESDQEGRGAHLPTAPGSTIHPSRVGLHQIGTQLGQLASHHSHNPYVQSQLNRATHILHKVSKSFPSTEDTLPSSNSQELKR